MAFAALYDRHERRAFNLAYRITGSREDAADATQEAFLKLLARLPGLADRELDFGAYLLTAVRHASYDVMARAKRADPTEELPESARPVGAAAAPPPEEEPDRSVLLAASQEEIRAANATLAPRQREALALRELEGLSYDEIAELMAMNRNSVAQLISRARIALRDALRRTALRSIAPGTPQCERALPLIAMRDDGQLTAADDAGWLDAHLAVCERCVLGREAMAEAGASYRIWAPVPALEILRRETIANAGERLGHDWSAAAGSPRTTPDHGRQPAPRRTAAGSPRTTPDRGRQRARRRRDAAAAASRRRRDAGRRRRRPRGRQPAPRRGRAAGAGAGAAKRLRCASRRARAGGARRGAGAVRRDPARPARRADRRRRARAGRGRRRARRAARLRGPGPGADRSRRSRRPRPRAAAPPPPPRPRPPPPPARRSRPPPRAPRGAGRRPPTRSASATHAPATTPRGDAATTAAGLARRTAPGHRAIPRHRHHHRRAPCPRIRRAAPARSSPRRLRRRRRGAGPGPSSRRPRPRRRRRRSRSREAPATGGVLARQPPSTRPFSSAGRASTSSARSFSVRSALSRKPMTRPGSTSSS